MATLYKHKTEGGLYYIEEQVQSMYLGRWRESVNYYTGEKRKFTQYGKWREEDLIPVSYV